VREAAAVAHVAAVEKEKEDERKKEKKKKRKKERGRVGKKRALFLAGKIICILP
jgi:hypothetical protein